MLQQSGNEHAIDLVERNKQWQVLRKNQVAYADNVSKAMGVALAYSLVSSLNATSKPTADFILQKVQAILGGSQNKSFKRTIEAIKNQTTELER